MDPVASQPINQGISYTAGIYQALSNPQIRGRTVGLLAVAAALATVWWCIHRYVVPIFERRMMQDVAVNFGIALQKVVHHLPPAPVDQPVCDIAEEDILRVIELDTDTSGWLWDLPTFNPEEEDVLALFNLEYSEPKGSYDGLHVINQCRRCCASAVACACMVILDIQESLEDESFSEMFDPITARTESTLDIVVAALNMKGIESSIKRVDELEQLKKMIDDRGSACLPICGQHYVMVDKIDDEGVRLRDPSEGRAIVLSEKSFMHYWNRSQEILQVKRSYGKNPSNGSLSG